MTGRGGGRCFRITSRTSTREQGTEHRTHCWNSSRFLRPSPSQAIWHVPFVRGRPLPMWLERARLRGKPGVPVTAWLGAVLLMLVVWLIGDQRGILALLLWLLWIAGPLVACWISWLWIRRARSTEQRAKDNSRNAESVLCALCPLPFFDPACGVPVTTTLGHPTSQRGPCHDMGITLATLLEGIRRLEDLVSLVRAAGHEPALQWLPAEGWRWREAHSRRRRRPSCHGFEWLAFETDHGAGGLAAAWPGGWSAPVAWPESSRSSLARESSPSRSASRRVRCWSPAWIARRPLTLRALERLAGGASDGGSGHPQRCARPGHRSCRAPFLCGFPPVAGPHERRVSDPDPTDERHGLALLQLTRVLFLYFVQAKGWLDANPHFLREHVDPVSGATGARCSATCSGRSSLAPSTRPPARRGATARRFGRLPFLNGGLFEPHPLERRWRAECDSLLWRDTFDELFERFEFTLTESDGDPRRTRHAGPRVRGADGTRASGSESGTFFTPSQLVAALVRATPYRLAVAPPPDPEEAALAARST